jgi:hypothetical protein
MKKCNEQPCPVPSDPNIEELNPICNIYIVTFKKSKQRKFLIDPEDMKFVR